MSLRSLSFCCIKVKACENRLRWYLNYKSSTVKCIGSENGFLFIFQLLCPLDTILVSKKGPISELWWMWMNRLLFSFLLNYV